MKDERSFDSECEEIRTLLKNKEKQKIVKCVKQADYM